MCGWWGRWARTCSCWACRLWSQLTRTRCVGVCAAAAVECGADCCGTKEAAALGDAATEAAQAAAVSDMHPALHDPQELKKIAAFLKVSRVIVLCPVVACAHSDALLSATTVAVTVTPLPAVHHAHHCARGRGQAVCRSLLHRRVQHPLLVTRCRFDARSACTRSSRGT